MENLTSFQEALKFTLKWEGGYSNDPSDSGGKTNYGVTHFTYKLYRKKKGLAPRDVRLITREEVIDVYRTLYWDASNCDRFPKKIAIAVFDFAVNSGVSRAIRKLQQLVRTPVDGRWGPKSQAALCEHIEQFGVEDLVQQYLWIRQRFFKAIAKGKNRKFLRGWLNRLNDLDKLLLN